jgi:hypothetical protein
MAKITVDTDYLGIYLGLPQDIVEHAQRADKLLREGHLDACYEELGAVQRLLSRAVEQLRRAREAKAGMERERRGNKSC